MNVSYQEFETFGPLRLISSRSYKKCIICPEINHLISISGRQNQFCYHRLDDLVPKSQKWRLSTEPRYEKFRDVVDIIDIMVHRDAKECLTVFVLLKASILILQWHSATAKFVKQKVFSVLC